MNVMLYIEVEIDGKTHEEAWAVEVEFSRGEPAVYYDSNNTGTPETPDDWEILECVLDDRFDESGASVDFEPMTLSSEELKKRSGMGKGFDSYVETKVLEEVKNSEPWDVD